MGKKTLSIALLATATAVAVFFALHITLPSSQSPNSSTPVSPSNPGSFNEAENAKPGASSGSDTTGHGDPLDGDSEDSNISELQKKYAGISDNPDYPQLQTRLDAMQKRQPNRSFDPEKVVEAMTQSEAWARVETPPDDLPLTEAEKFDGREFIRFNPLRIETMMPGDTLEIPIWQLGARYKMRVDRTETHANGSVTWHGHLENFNEPHRVTITVGDGLSLGGIDTPGGHYVLQAHGESGWIASSETLFKRNESETDMVIPPAGELEGSP